MESYVSLSKLESERPGNPHESLNAYYESISGGPYETTASALRNAVSGLRENDLVVGISPDGCTRMYKSEMTGNEFNPTGGSTSRVSVWELPEDEFYFFKAFRHGLFDLEKQVPAFLLQMSFVYVYTLFENYIAEILRTRLMAHPGQMGLSKKIAYREIFETTSREELIEQIVDREMSRLMYEPIDLLLKKMRDDFGFRSLSEAHDQSIYGLSLTRNCLLHNAGKANEKLAKVIPSISDGQQIIVEIGSVSEAIDICRKLCVEIDSAFESLEATGALSTCARKVTRSRPSERFH